MKSIKTTINKLKKLGYEATYDYINCNNSCYLEIIKDGVTFFILRLSDHNLREGNQLPAGVLNEYYYSIKHPIPIKFLRWDIDEVSKMSKDEYDYLWTNRYIIKNEYGRLVAEPFSA